MCFQRIERAEHCLRRVGQGSDGTASCLNTALLERNQHLPCRVVHAFVRFKHLLIAGKVADFLTHLVAPPPQAAVVMIRHSVCFQLEPAVNDIEDLLFEGRVIVLGKLDQLRRTEAQEAHVDGKGISQGTERFGLIAQLPC